VRRRIPEIEIEELGVCEEVKISCQVLGRKGVGEGERGRRVKVGNMILLAHLTSIGLECQGSQQATAGGARVSAARVRLWDSEGRRAIFPATKGMYAKGSRLWKDGPGSEGDRFDKVCTG